MRAQKEASKGFFYVIPLYLDLVNHSSSNICVPFRVCHSPCYKFIAMPNI